jgi:hypothetical protein
MRRPFVDGSSWRGNGGRYDAAQLDVVGSARGRCGRANYFVGAT